MKYKADLFLLLICIPLATANHLDNFQQNPQSPNSYMIEKGELNCSGSACVQEIKTISNNKGEVVYTSNPPKNETPPVIQKRNDEGINLLAVIAISGGALLILFIVLMAKARSGI